jgi:predicted nucleic acid-binding protein
VPSARNSWRDEAGSVNDHVDSSVLVAALLDSERQHAACLRLLGKGRLAVHVHALAETFSTLTGGRLLHRVLPVMAARVLEESVLPRVTTVSFTAIETIEAMKEAQARGIRGGAFYDYLHLVAARKSGARRLYTLNRSDFLSFHRSGDPEIVHP